jgi:flagellar biosynthesis protein FlgN
VVTPGKSGEVAGLLSQELVALQSFIELLRREQELLASGATDGLTNLAAAKSAAALELGRLAAARDAELARCHLPTGRAGMDAWTLTNAGVPSQSNWDQLLRFAAEARALNEANGKMIALQLQHNQQALSVLMAAADQTSTYGPDGQPRAGTGGRSLGSA